MIRILQIVNIMDRAGLENVLMNYYRNIDRSTIQFDFLVHRDKKGAYDDEILSLGGKIYHAPRLYPQNYVKYFQFMNDFFKNHPEYVIVHSHIDALSSFPLYAAKKANIPVRIAHSHSSKLDHDLKYPIKKIALMMINRVATNYFSCSNVAGKFMFGNSNFKIMYNAIDLLKYQYNDSVRKKIRNQLKLGDSLVVGHVGRFYYVKNQLFLLDVFKKINDCCEKSVLLLVGDGPDLKKIHKKIIELQLQDKILILSNRDDVNELYQAMDVFVMPSLFEGLPMVGVEAQASGLPCFFSGSISNEVLLTSNSQMISLKKESSVWSDTILKSDLTRNTKSYQELTAKGYDIQTQSTYMQEWYINSYNKCMESI